MSETCKQVDDHVFAKPAEPKSTVEPKGPVQPKDKVVSVNDIMRNIIRMETKK